MTSSGADLALQIRTELSAQAPAGLRFSDHVIAQDSALLRLREQLVAHPDRGEVEAALGLALTQEKDGWTALKLLELAEQLGEVKVAPALLSFVQNPPGEGDRARFLAGRACEVLLRLPLDVATRNAANELCARPLEDLVRFRLGADKARALHRPRRVEWTLLVVLMALGLIGLVFAFRAL